MDGYLAGPAYEAGAGERLPADEWIAAPGLFGWLAFRDPGAVDNILGELRSTVGPISDQPQLMARIEALGNQCDQLLALVRSGIIKAYAADPESVDLKVVPPWVFTAGLTINVFDGRIARSNEDPDRGCEPFAKVRAAGLVGAVWFKRDELAKCSLAVSADGCSTLGVPLGNNAPSRESFARARDKLSLMIAWAQATYATGKIPSRDVILADHRKEYGSIVGISEPLIRDLLREIAPGRVGGAPAHKNSQDT